MCTASSLEDRGTAGSTTASRRTPMTLVSLGRRAAALAAVALTVGCMGTASASVRVPLSGWNGGTPPPQGNDLKAVDFLGGRGYAVGAAGTALRTDDGGLAW